MKEAGAPGQEPEYQDAPERDPLARFRSWRGFLLAAIVLNLLFVYGMYGNTAGSGLGTWYKSLIWLPFNVISSVLYYVLPTKLARLDAEAGREGAVARFERSFYFVLCVFMIVANWLVMFSV